MDFELGINTITLGNGLSFDDIDIFGNNNVVLTYEGDRIGVIVGVTPTEFADSLL